jgi:putative peptidoglycan lipid II flippase
MGLGLASALASYLNLGQLWLALRRDGVYRRQPGWTAHLARLGAACAVMCGVLLAGLARWPDWSDWNALTRVAHLSILVAAGGGAFVAVLFAAGFRLRDLRGH